VRALLGGRADSLRQGDETNKKDWLRKSLVRFASKVKVTGMLLPRGVIKNKKPKRFWDSLARKVLVCKKYRRRVRAKTKERFRRRHPKDAGGSTAGEGVGGGAKESRITRSDDLEKSSDEGAQRRRKLRRGEKASSLILKKKNYWTSRDT